MASIEDQWAEFKVTHKRNYETQEEETHRFQIFQENVRKIEEHNKKYDSGEASYTMGINNFSDLTREEFKSKYCGGLRPDA